jgi:hypothetical protein
MIKSLAFAVISIILLHGCENVDVVETKIEYRERIVVSAELAAETFFTGMTFTRTMPLDETYDIKKAELRNVDSYLRINSVKIVPLHYQADGLYLPADSLMIEEGDLYELIGNINGKSFYSETRIPERPSITNALKETDYIQVSVTPREGEVYGGKWIIIASGTGDTIASANKFSSIIQNSELNTSPTLSVRTDVIPNLYLSSAYSDRIFVEVCSFDKAYLNYYNSRSGQNVAENAFIQGGESVAWNVYGEDVIGLFIGMGKSRIKAR